MTSASQRDRYWVELRLWQSAAHLYLEIWHKTTCLGRKRVVVTCRQREISPRKKSWERRLWVNPSSLPVVSTVCCRQRWEHLAVGWLHQTLETAQVPVDADGLGAHRPGFGTELSRRWFHPDTVLVLTALFLLVSPSFCPLRTTAASLSRGTWLRILRRSLGTCS